MRAAAAKVQPDADCVPCHKEIICSEKASALIRTGHLLMQQGAWTAADLTAWNGMLDAFILQAQAALEAGPLANRGRGSSAAGGGDDLTESPGNA